MNDISWLLNLFRINKNKIAIIEDNNKYTYLEFINRIEYYVSFLLENTISSKKIVAINSEYSFESISFFFALVKNKNIIVPIVSNIKHEVMSKLSVVNADFLITFHNKTIKYEKQESNFEKHKLIKELHKTGDSGLVLFSSGSTGEPKAMLHNFDKLQKSYKNKKQKSINTLVFLSFDHIGGIDTMLRIFSISGTVTIPDTRGIEDICKIIEEHKIDVLPATPTFLNLLLLGQLHKQYDLSSLSIISFGAEPMPESLLKVLGKEFSYVSLQQKFGTSETNAISVRNQSNNSLFIKIDDPNVEYKIVDNELCLKSKTQVMGYLNSSMESFTNDGWFKTGDLVETTDDGFIKIIGRNKEVINVGGEKVLPSEVESVILSMDIIDDVMVYSQSNIITGQTVVCDAVFNIDIATKEAKKLIRKFCKNTLDGYKIPTKVNLVDATNFSSRFKKIRK